MNLGVLLHGCNYETKKLYRKIEKTKKKIIETEWSIKYNDICIN